MGKRLAVLNRSGHVRIYDINIINGLKWSALGPNLARSCARMLRFGTVVCHFSAKTDTIMAVTRSCAYNCGPWTSRGRGGRWAAALPADDNCPAPSAI